MQSALKLDIDATSPSAASQPVRLVAGIISRGQRFLITRRRLSAALPGLWEFPGGRVESGESDAAALARETRERVGLDIDVGRLVVQRVHRYEGYAVQMLLYQTTVRGDAEPQALRVADFKWVSPDELERYPFPPADQPTMDVVLGFSR